MKKKMTSVSIVRETLPTELQCKIKELAKTSVDLGVSKERFVFEFTKARNRYLESLLELTQEKSKNKSNDYSSFITFLLYFSKNSFL